MVEYFSDIFFQTATQATELFVPIVAILLLFRLVHDILWK